MRTIPIVLSLLMLGVSACHGHHHQRTRGPSPIVSSHRPGPPPHAPAHGRRHKDASRVSAKRVFDADLDAYIIVGLDHHYFRDGRYYRWARNAWMVSEHLEHGWVAIRVDLVPARIAHRHSSSPGRGKKKGHWKHPAKHAY